MANLVKSCFCAAAPTLCNSPPFSVRPADKMIIFYRHLKIYCIVSFRRLSLSSKKGNPFTNYPLIAGMWHSVYAFGYVYGREQVKARSHERLVVGRQTDYRHQFVATFMTPELRLVQFGHLLVNSFNQRPISDRRDRMHLYPS